MSGSSGERGRELASKRARWVTALLLTLGLGLTSACTGDNGPSDPVPRSGAGESGGGAPQVVEFHPDDALVEQTVALPTSPEDEVTWGVLSLRVEGPTMTLQLAVTPQFGTVSATGTVSLFECLQRTSFRPTLVDMQNLKEYSVITDPPHHWSSGAAQTKSVNGQPMLAWAVYAAPEDDIDTITVRIADWWPPILDVPIER